MKFLGRAAGLIIGVTGMVAPAMGQNGQRGLGGVPMPAPHPMGMGGTRAQFGPPMKALGGVRAEVPRPIAGLGGSAPRFQNVRSVGPRALGSFPQVLPRAPSVFSGPVQRMPALDGAARFRLPSGNGIQRPVDLISSGGSGGASIADVNGVQHSNSNGDRVFRPGRTFVSPSGVLAIDSSGLTVDGSVHGDRSRLSFHLGTGLFPFVAHHHGDNIVHRYPYYRSWPYWYGYGYGYDNGYYGPVYTPPESTQVPGTPTNQPPPPELTPLELADLSLAEGHAPDAVRRYRAYLRVSPEDAAAMRSLALALIQEKKIPEGVAVMAMAYDRDPGLANQPIQPASLGEGLSGLHHVLLAVVPYANRSSTASSWLTATVLMQAEGRDDAAQKMLKKSQDQGLNEKVGRALEAALLHR